MPISSEMLDFRKDKSIPFVRYGIYEYNKPRELHAILLPMPGGIETSDDADWEAEDNWGMVAAGAAGSAVEKTKAGYEKGKAGKTGVVDKIKGGGQAAADLTAAAAEVGKTIIGNLSPTAKTMARAKSINMQKEHFWKGKAFRSFTFAHKLNADNQVDSEKIRTIIKALRIASAPSIDGTHFLWPSDVWPRFYSGGKNENTWLPKIERCIIKGVSVNYTSQEPYHQHVDGSPTIIELSFELEEIVQQTRTVVNSKHGSVFHRPTLNEKFKEESTDTQIAVTQGT